MMLLLFLLGILAEQPGKQGDKGDADQRHAAARHELLHTLAFGTRVVVAVTFEQVDCTPDAEAGTERDDESLENIHSRIKKIHKRFCRNHWVRSAWNLATNSKSRNESCHAAPIPASPFIYFVFISMIRSDHASEEVSFIQGIYEKPPLLRRRACALRLGLRQILRRPHLLSEPALWTDIFQY